MNRKNKEGQKKGKNYRDNLRICELASLTTCSRRLNRLDREIRVDEKLAGKGRRVTKKLSE